MRIVTIELSEETAVELDKLAAQRQVSVEDVAREMIDHSVERRAAFVAAADYVMKKNAELYRRLS